VVNITDVTKAVHWCATAN